MSLVYRDPQSNLFSSAFLSFSTQLIEQNWLW